MELGIGDWQAHGFVSQGYTLTSEYNAYGHSTGNGSLDFTEIGVNVLGHLQPNLLIAAQGLYRNGGGSDREDFRLDFANLDYHFSLGKQATAGIRLGRVKNPFGLYNDTRDVVWTRPGVFIPQSVYFDSLALRQAMISSDGGILYNRFAVGDHALKTEFVVSEPLDDTGGAAEFLTGIPNARGKLGGRPLFIGRMGYEWQEGRFRLLFSVVNLDRDFKSATPGVSSGNLKVLYPLASAQVNLEDWSFTGEYGRITAERSGFTPGGVTLENTSESFYVQAQYRFTQDWSALLRYDSFTANVNDRSGNHLAAMTGLPKHRFYARDLTAGLRWEVVRNWMIAGEYHSVWGTGLVSPVDNPDLNQRNGPERWDMFSIMLSYRF
ncbi:hypothetical protein [Candidatus Methylobacter favarea]|uniref:hypothetical protein n=1 Tax=Candidatus Methylobacter favarea TaxID=2707345 RepID=UPI001C2D36AE|nr:hypothetical protein [Candidatus Methylobacter favarea]